MLIGHSMPAVVGMSLANATWLTADGGAALVDGKPARVARLQATGNPVITLDFAEPFTPRVIGLLGLVGIAPGASITVAGAAAAALGGNAATQTAVRFADGSVGAWIVTDGTAATDQLVVTIAGMGVIDIGEVVAMPAVDVDINRDWQSGHVDPSELLRGRGSQVSSIRRQDYRTFSATLSPAGAAAARAGALTGGMDWGQLRRATAGGQRSVAVPRWRVPGSQAVDASEVQATALYGVCKLPSIAHLGGDYYGAEIDFEEVPALS